MDLKSNSSKILEFHIFNHYVTRKVPTSAESDRLASFKEGLSHWSNEHNVPPEAVTELLGILRGIRGRGYEALPKDINELNRQVANQSSQQKSQQKSQQQSRSSQPHHN